MKRRNFVQAAGAVSATLAWPALVRAQAIEKPKLTIAVGGIGCVWGGRIADRIGHERFVIGALTVSGACCLAAAMIYGQPLWILLPVALVWGASVVADSAQFSTLVTRSVPAHAVGTALTLQTSLGFLLTMISMQLVPVMVDMFGWRWAFTFLAIGPAFGIAAIRRLLPSRLASRECRVTVAQWRAILRPVALVAFSVAAILALLAPRTCRSSSSATSNAAALSRRWSGPSR